MKDWLLRLRSYIYFKVLCHILRRKYDGPIHLTLIKNHNHCYCAGKFGAPGWERWNQRTTYNKEKNSIINNKMSFWDNLWPKL